VAGLGSKAIGTSTGGSLEIADGHYVIQIIGGSGTVSRAVAKDVIKKLK
jgi:hypothetical protein